MRILMFLGFCAALTGCITVPVPASVSSSSFRPSEAPLMVTAPAMDSFDVQFAAARAAQGLPPLSSNAGLDEVATAYSREMYVNGYFSHVDRHGGRAQDRVEKIGVTRCGIGENLAWGQKSVPEVMAGWMTSPTHRRNMLNPDYVSYGIGRVGNTWTLLFAVPC